MAINLPVISKFDNKGVKQAQGAFDGLGKKLLGLGAIVAGAFSVKAIVDFAKEATLAAEAIETSQERIDAIAESMGLFGDDTDAVTKRLKDFADANEQAFAIDENVIMQAQATLLTFGELGKTAGEAGGAFDRATTAAIDLAAAGFGSVETNAIQLGKALQDPIKGLTALGRSGVTFTDAEKELIKTMVESGDIMGAQELVLAAIEKQVGGTAAATADASVKMALAFGEVKETVGAAILPAFQAFTEALLPLIDILLPKLKDFLDRTLGPALMTFAQDLGGVISGLATGSITLSGILSELFQSFTSFFTGDGLNSAFERISEIRQRLIETILEALPGIVDGIVALLPVLLGFIVNTLIPQMISQFVFLIDELAALLTQLIPVLLDAVVALVPDLIRAVADILPQLVRTITQMIPTLLNTAVTLFLSLVNAVVEILPELLDAIFGMLPDIVDSVMDMLPGIITAGIELFNGLIQAVIKVLPQLIKQIIAMLPVILDTIIGMLPQLIEAGFELFMGIVLGLLDALPQIIVALLGMIPQIVDAIMRSIPKIVVLGFEIVRGLVKGIIDNAPRLITSAIQSLFNTVSNTVKSVFGISSPSKVFAEFGNDMIDGLANGLKDGAREIGDAVEDIGKATDKAFATYGGTIKAEAALTGGLTSGMIAANVAMTPDFVVPMGGAVSSAGGGAPIVNYITVNAGMGADGNRIGEQIVNEILRFERSSGRVFARA
jgi:hypothetical protein